MPDGGILLALPAQSVAIRLVLGAITAFVVVRWVLHANLQTARIRVAAALVPVAVLVAVLGVSLADPRLPTLMVPADGGGQVLLGLGNDYTYLVPLALPALVAAWALVAGGRIALRLVRTAMEGRRTRQRVAAGHLPDDLARLVKRLAGQFGVRAPDAAVVDCPGGAAAVGIRRPVLLLDEAFVSSLDPTECEGVVAHELAHVARRDNLIALLFGIARDLTFFIPGGTWAIRHLLVERELAADQAAIRRTHRPGALAAGLVKVLDHAHGDRAVACAALMPPGTLTTRVAALCDDGQAPGTARHTGEAVALLTTFLLLVTIATVVPRALAGDDPEAALGLYVAGGDSPSTTADAGNADGEVPPPKARALATYHDSVDLDAPSAEVHEPSGRAEFVDEPGNLTAGMLRTCATGGDCGIPEPDSSTLELRPRPVLVQADIEVRWHASQIAHSGDFRVYRLSSLH